MKSIIEIVYSPAIVSQITIPYLKNILALAPLVVIAVPYILEIIPESWSKVYKYLIMTFASFCAAFVSIVTAKELTDMHKKLDEHGTTLGEHGTTLGEHSNRHNSTEAAIKTTNIAINAKADKKDLEEGLDGKVDKSELNKSLLDFPGLIRIPSDGDDAMGAADFARYEEMVAIRA